VAVVLVYGYGYTLREVSELTGVRKTTVQTHVERGLARLRAKLGVEPWPVNERHGDLCRHRPAANP
jgi:DNA-directed RNA polymerase specialized sigma24 family protein